MLCQILCLHQTIDPKHCHIVANSTIVDVTYMYSVDVLFVPYDLGSIKNKDNVLLV